MKGINWNRQAGHLTALVLCTVVLHLFLWLPKSWAEPVKSSLSLEETHRLGERMFREAVLPSGRPMQVVMPGDHAVPGTTFACAGCHLRSGLGAVEEGVCYPAINGARLFKPFQPDSKRGIEGNLSSYPLQHHRPVYTDATLAETLRAGLDPAGRKISEAMPRYRLNDDEMAIMASYLKSLSSEYSPGVSETGLKFATVITDDVSQEDRDAALTSLLGFIGSRDRKARLLKQLAGLTKGSPMFEGEMMLSKSKPISLSPWILKGPPETWRAQLEEYNRKEPVFALLGGISKGEWAPIHHFSEDHRIPCIFPDTDFPVISRTDWYTLYLSKGYYQEGETAARHLNSAGEILKGKPVVQIVRDSREGRALSAGFEETWRDLGHGAPVLITLKPGQELTRDSLRQLLARQKPAAVVLWDGPEALPALERLAAGENRPEMVYISSRYVGESLWTMKEQVRDLAYVTYPFKLPRSHHNKVTPSNLSLSHSSDLTKQANQAYSITQVLTMALMEMKGNYYRDNFLDVIGMNEDFEVPLYERLNFGAGQRYASKGCYIVQLAGGDKPVLVKKSDWLAY